MPCLSTTSGVLSLSSVGAQLQLFDLSWHRWTSVASVGISQTSVASFGPQLASIGPRLHQIDLSWHQLVLSCIRQTSVCISWSSVASDGPQLDLRKFRLGQAVVSSTLWLTSPRRFLLDEDTFHILKRILKRQIEVVTSYSLLKCILKPQVVTSPDEDTEIVNNSRYKSVS